ncbi:MAG: zinc ribbon domain-containing protein [Gemmatimonadetes bacterium]|nr:zinc ribbon domain-containing protein [Gemmatimonadota bacterium]
MPTYEYRCPKCGHEYEKVQKISDNTRPKCPKCGTRGERMISGGVGVVFKGSGFYATDYKRTGEKKSGDESATPKTEKPAKIEKPAETSSSKPADKSKKKPGAES